MCFSSTILPVVGKKFNHNKTVNHDSCIDRERNWEAQRGKEESDLQAQKDEIDAKLKLSDASQTALQEQRQKAHIQLKELKSAGEYLESLLQEFATQAEQIRQVYWT